MTDKEKVKAYDEAIERANKVLLDCTKEERNVVEYLHPELKESEDGNIVEKLIQYFKKFNLDTFAGFDPKEILAWLEKQGRQKPLYIRFGDVQSNETSKIYRGEVEIGEENGVSVYPAFEVNGNIVLGLTLPITKTTLYTQQHLLEYDNRPCYLVSGDYVGKGTDGEPLIRNITIIKRLDNYRIKNFEKQGEQMPADKVEPKFEIEEGKWYVCIRDLLDNYANKAFRKGDIYLSTQNGSLIPSNSNVPFEVVCPDTYFKDWTIQDAKDGDVLVSPPLRDDPSTEQIFMFKMIDNRCYLDNCIEFYNRICDGVFYENEEGYYMGTTSSPVYPATKEQRDLFFKKMHEAGYEWDAERKKLKKLIKK